MFIILNPVINCSKFFLSFSVDKVTTGTYNFVSVIWNAAFVGEVSLRLFVLTLFSMLVITHSLDWVKIKDTSQLINGISNVLQKLLRYFNGTAVLTSFLPDLFGS